MNARHLRVVLVGLPTIVLLAVSARAEIREFGWYGTVRQIAPDFASALPPEANVAVAHPAFVRYAFETTTPDQDPTPTGGNYVGALTSFTIRIGDYGFTQRVAGPSNAIMVLADSFFRFYEAVTSVDPPSPIPGHPDLRGDVLFEPRTPSQIPSGDLILTVPDPDDWSTASSAFLSPIGEVLLEVDLVAICIGTCQPVPEPASGLAWAVGLVSLAGWGRRRGRRRSIAQRARASRVGVCSAFHEAPSCRGNRAARFGSG